VTKTQFAGPISCLEHRATRVLHCAIVTRAAVLMFPLLLQTFTSNQMMPRRLRGAWFSRLLRHPARRRSGSILSPGNLATRGIEFQGHVVNLKVTVANQLTARRFVLLLDTVSLVLRCVTVFKWLNHLGV